MLGSRVIYGEKPVPTFCHHPLERKAASGMELSFASYNIHKAVGLDGRRDPDRILAILREEEAVVVALQEADRRYGRRISALPRQAIDDHTPYRLVPLAMTPDGIGWHGNALLVRRGIEVVAASPVPLPMLEPRGAVCAQLRLAGRLFCVVGMHLDLSGLRRRRQLQAVKAHVARSGQLCPTVLMGDFNQWSRQGGAMRIFETEWQALVPGLSFPSRRPLAPLDRIVASQEWRMIETGVHQSALAAIGSDHLPVFARLQLPPGA